MDRRLALLLLLCSGQALAEFSFEYDFDANKKPWQEIEAQLPAAPKAENLVPIDLGPASPHHYFVDRASVSAGPDGVVRYTMVVHTAGGAEDISYEGMRCSTAEQKTYAFGREDGKWARNKYANWAPIQFRVVNGYQGQLFQHYFCTVWGAAQMKVIQHALSVGGISGGDY